jgi:hypothetical protein
MAAARDTTNANIKPLEGAIVRKVQAGATIDAGELITLQSDGKWDPTATTAAQLTVRVALQDAVDGDYIDSVVFGPVKNMTGATIGALIYASDTAGELGETAGTKDLVVGHAESATVLFVQPQIIDFT